MSAVDISFLSLAAGYGLLIFPLSIILWYRIPIVSDTLLAVLRMTVQLLFVGLYLQVVFSMNNFWLNGVWLLVMVGVADTSITRGCGLRLSRFAGPLFLALLVGTAVPLFFFVVPILGRPHLLDAQYAIPIGGVILGNCLRADIIGVGNFYRSIRKSEKTFLQALAQGARFAEATRPFLRDACLSSHGGYDCNHRTGIPARHDDGCDTGWRRPDDGHQVPDRHHDRHFFRYHHYGSNGYLANDEKQLYDLWCLGLPDFQGVMNEWV
jgi:ABC-type iron transport system FetAB permease component